VHELVVIDLNPPITIGIEPSERLAELLDNDTSADEAVEANARWRPTILTDRGCFDVCISQKDKMDGGGRGWDSPYFLWTRSSNGAERLKLQCWQSDESLFTVRTSKKSYPNCARASRSSCPSIDPERSRSKCLKTFCQS